MRTPCFEAQMEGDKRTEAEIYEDKAFDRIMRLQMLATPQTVLTMAHLIKEEEKLCGPKK